MDPPSDDPFASAAAAGSTVERAVGAAFGLRDAVAGGLAGAQDLGRRTLGVAGRAMGPVIDGAVRHLAASPELDELLRAKVTALLPRLAADPAVAALVREQIERVLAGLVGHALVAELVRTQAEAVIEHLRSHPEALETLVSGQGQRFLDERRRILRRKAAAAAGIDVDLIDEIRARRETGESVLGILTRRVRRGLRRLHGGEER